MICVRIRAWGSGDSRRESLASTSVSVRSCMPLFLLCEEHGTFQLSVRPGCRLRVPHARPIDAGGRATSRAVWPELLTLRVDGFIQQGNAYAAEKRIRFMASCWSQIHRAAPPPGCGERGCGAPGRSAARRRAPTRVPARCDHLPTVTDIGQVNLWQCV